MSMVVVDTVLWLLFLSFQGPFKVKSVPYGLREPALHSQSGYRRVK